MTKKIIDQIMVNEFGHVHVREAERLTLPDGRVIPINFHRQVLKPGDSLEDQDEKVAAVAKAVWK